MFFLRRFNLPCNHSKKMLDEKNGGIHSPGIYLYIMCLM